MVAIQILAIAGAADTSSQGESARSAIVNALAQSDIVTISFAGVSTATSSFINVALVPLLDSMSLDEVKRRIRITQSTRQINEMIKARLTRQALQVA